MKPTDNVTPCDAAPLPHQIVDFGEGERALRATRDVAAQLAEYTCLCEADRFASWMSVVQMSSALLIETRMSHVLYDRSALLVGRSGLNQYDVVPTLPPSWLAPN